MSNVQSYQKYLSSEYPGYLSFIENIIEPIFGSKFEANAGLLQKASNTKLVDRFENIIRISSDEQLKQEAQNSGLTSMIKLGSIELDNTEVPLLVYDITISKSKDLAKNRKGIQSLTRRMLEKNSGAFMIFHYADKLWEWRFSYCFKGMSDDESTNAKRFTYLLGPNQACRTAAQRFDKLRKQNGSIKLQDIENAFSVEALSKEFFEKYKVHYGRFVGYVIGKEYVDKGEGKGEWRVKEGLAPSELFAGLKNDEKVVRDYVKKLLGRIVFLHFLQKKGWLGATDAEWTDGPQDFMSRLFDQASKEQKDNFLDDILEPLFSCLDTPLDERNDVFDTKVEGLRSVRVPFLGGLFERDEQDKAESVFPSELFEGLFKFLGEYNFTIDENDPNDAQVGVDPEMLGRIFENLLEDNKDKGAFYTPKEIVQYMCRESLIAYLQTDVTDEATREALRQFVTSHDVSVLGGRDSALALNVSQCLKDVKICDPAIGSGAFPMGLLNELFLCRGVIEDFSNAADIKRHIIQQNIYGVDIEKGAVDIARLRFWLSLIIEEVSPHALPNLDFKIMQGNSLLEQYRGFDLSKIMQTKKVVNGSVQLTMFETDVDELRRQLIALRKLYYNSNNKDKKLSLRTRMREIVQEQINILKYEIDLSYIDIAANDQFFLWHTWFADVFEEGGFNIVIGNPPYIKEDFNSSAFVGFKEHSPYYMGKMDLWYGFACHGVDLLKDNGILSFIAQNNWTTSAGAKKMRNKIAEESTILQMVDFNEYMVFGASASIQTMIMIFQRNSTIDNYTIDLRRLINNPSKENMLEILSKQKGTHCEYLAPIFNRSNRINSYFTFSIQDELLDKIGSQPCRFAEKEATNGIHPHYDFVNKKIHTNHPEVAIGEGIFGLSNEEKINLSLSTEENELVKPYYTSEQVKRYFTDKNNTLWIIYTGSEFKNPSSMEPYPNLKRHLDKYDGIISSDNKPYGLHRARQESFFVDEKIAVLRKCVGKPSFSYSDFDCYLSATFYVLKTNRWNMKFLTGLLNSKLIEFWLRNRGKMQGQNFQLDKEPLLNIPLPTESCEQQPIIALVDQILSTKKLDPQTDTSALESEIDSLVYGLYSLTEEEIAIVEGTKPENEAKTKESTSQFAKEFLKSQTAKDKLKTAAKGLITG